MISVRKYLKKLGVPELYEQRILSFAIRQGMEVKKLGNVYLMNEGDIMGFGEDIKDESRLIFEEKEEDYASMVVNYVRLHPEGVTGSQLRRKFQMLGVEEIHGIIKGTRINKKTVKTSTKPATVYFLD